MLGVILVVMAALYMIIKMMNYSESKWENGVHIKFLLKKY
ncbi:hypothetical protein bcere0022_48750 [Bacillus cereus Rock3-44]|nr:hypothetical protein bcere0022_48750 [Bacillus cereus Rock3-44]